MATGWVGFVGPTVGKIGEFLMAPVGRHFGYLFSYKSKVKNLKDEVKKLDEKRDAMQLSVDEAKRNVKRIGPDVKGWLERVDKCRIEAREILKDEVEASKGCLYGWCPNLPLRYSLSKKATNKAKEVAQLHEERKLTEVAYNEPLPGIEFTSTEGIKLFESRRLIMNDVMEALKDDRFHMITICGMGGVGKTTMVKEVAKRAKELKLFDEVVMAVVSQSPNERKIQGEIGDNLGLKFEEETERGRANRLCERLRRTNRILVILDDVWKRLELNDIGIPFGDGHRGCKILLTSRFDNVCNDMNAQKKFTVEVLTEEEAWNLFQEMAGISNHTSHTSTDLYITQKKVADECGCLPIAIVTVARALKGKDEQSWNSALLQLRKSMVKNIREVEENVFKSLELSYNFLGSREIKECFLLCSLYAEDFNIPIEDLVRYGVGIEMFEAIDSVNEARDRVHAFVDDLKKGYLLMDGEQEGCVKIHDVVRDVAISIASREEHSFMVRCDEALKEWPEKERHKNYAVISLRCTGMSKLPDNLEFPELHLLRLEDNYASKLPNLPDSFYGGMKELKALSMLNVYIKGSLPTSLRWLTNLRSLSLYECGLINDVSVIGALENLEILSFEGTQIEELPKEIGRLSHLKLLDLLRCDVKTICPGVLSSLSKLEELYLGSSFNDVYRTKATLTELCGLSNFTTLVIHLRHFAYWPRDLVLTNLKAFAISIEYRNSYLSQRMIGTRDCRDYQLQNQLSLEDLHESDLMESEFKNLLKITKIVELTRAVGVKNVGYDLDKDGFKKLTELSLQSCQDLEYVIDTTDGVPVPQIAFPVLQSLCLENLDKLKEICHGQLPEEAFSALKRLKLQDLPALTHLWKGPTQLVRLHNLTSLELQSCHKLERMFSLSIARDLMQLQILHVCACRKMEVLISSEEEGDQNEIASTTTETTDKIVFPKLKELYLDSLPSFTAICEVMNGIELLQLNELKLCEIPMLNSFCNTSDSNYDTIQPLFNKVAFSALKELKLWGVPASTHLWKGPTQLVRLRNLTFLELKRCDKLESMFSLSIARDLMQLEILRVSKCHKLEVLISSEEEGDQNEIASTTTETTDKIVFPKLKELYLESLPSFTAICEVMNGIELLQLNELKLCEIPMLNSFCNTSDSNYDTIQPLFNKVKLITIEKLVISGMDNVIEIWPRELQPKVGEMLISHCRKLLNILKGMQSIERLIVGCCQSVEVAFDLEGMIVREGYPDIVLPSLTVLDLLYLPKLTHVWKNNLLRIPSVQNLTSLAVVGCSSLRYIFSSSQAKLLVKLRQIFVAECGVLEAIVNEEPKVDDEVATNIIMLPQLNSLELYHLPNLKSLCPQAYTFEGSFFKKIEVINCPNMRALPSALQRMLELQESSVREVEFFNSAQHHLLDRKFSLSTKGMLDVTGIDEPTEIWHNQLEVGCLHKVRFMRVQCCGKLSSVVSSKLMQRLHNIQWLKVWWCDSLEMIFDLQEGVCADVAEKEILITQLSKLILKYLPKLTNIWKNISQQTHCFKNLRFLTVQHCDNLRYIFTISMANVLVNLLNLTVEHCEKVEKIVTRENEEIFSQRIYSIKLINLPSLVCFGPDVNNTEIPARRTSVRLCPKFPGNEDEVDFDFDGIEIDLDFEDDDNNEDEVDFDDDDNNEDEVDFDFDGIEIDLDFDDDDN
ncbi:disease resistance protein At4g27190-like isoform X3 [Camellia sinensis]|uniref:disease resistance protein At4g27190-like isoform X3 n=1 Tax=Camellia sinensis TaxID=4442 RepID=UPI0010367C98|nr:disease resistance protein At4g27190-like isoform X3 [Camellia sinensis]